VPLRPWLIGAGALLAAVVALSGLPWLERTGIFGLARRSRGPNPEAYELYLQGRYYRGLNRPDALLKSAQLFEQAVNRDPQLAEAQAALAGSLATLGFHQLLPHSDAVPRAEAAARKALDLDPKLAEAHAALGWVRFYYHRDWARAEQSLRRAIALDPGSARFRQRLAFLWAAQGRSAEAIVESRRAAEMDPSFVATNDLGMILYFARRFEEAARQARKVIEMDPDHLAAHALLGSCLVARGHPQEALAEFRRATGPASALSPVLGRLGHAYALAGRRREALAALEQLQQSAASPGDHYTQMAFIYTALGQKEQALACLRKVAERREGEANFMAVEAVFDTLRSDAAFAALLKTLGSDR